MELILFCGLQGAGKTTVYQANFSATHLRISLDVVRTRGRERAILDACLSTGQRAVIDNTSTTRAERAVYVERARAAHFRVIAALREEGLGGVAADRRLAGLATQGKRALLAERGIDVDAVPHWMTRGAFLAWQSVPQEGVDARTGERVATTRNCLAWLGALGGDAVAQRVAALLGRAGGEGEGP